MKRAAIYYYKISPSAQGSDSELCQLRKLGAAKGYELQEYCDREFSGTKTRRPGFGSLMADAWSGKLSVLIVASLDRVAKSVRHFLQVINELDDLGIAFVSAKEGIDTSSENGRLFVAHCLAIAELERSLTAAKIRQGMRRARFEGQRLGRAPLDIDHQALVRDRLAGMSLTDVAKKYGVSRASVVRFTREAQRRESELYGGDLMIADQTTAVACTA